MYSFNGRFNNRLDDKNRIRIPAKYKAELGEDYKLSFGPSESIYVLPKNEYEKILASFGEVTLFDEEGQNAIAEFTGMVFDVVEDNQGRIVLPLELRTYAGIDKEIVITGAASFIRIEALEKFEERTKNRNVTNIFAKLNSLSKKEC